MNIIGDYKINEVNILTQSILKSSHKYITHKSSWAL